MKLEPFKPPSDWTDDELSLFIQYAMNNIIATFNNKKMEFEILKNIDNFFQTIINNLLNTPDTIPALLLLRAHSAYRGACRMSLSGQVMETFVLLRSCIECSLYALHINQSVNAGDKWLNRHNDENAKRMAKKEFTHSNVMNTLESTDPTLSQITKNIYDRTIDYGAHPNERSIMASLKIAKEDGRTELKQLYLDGDSINLIHGLKSTAQVGLCALFIIRHVFKERFDIIGVTEEMNKYRAIL